MLYFSYGSNMSSRRIRHRLPSASPLAIASLHQHALRFHKKSPDGSAKCDAHHTGRDEHRIIGVLFDISEQEKQVLDRIEGLGHGYEAKTVEVSAFTGEILLAFTYYATAIDAGLKPYHWYKHHVLTGARENKLPASYIQTIALTESVCDPEQHRHCREMAIYETATAHPDRFFAQPRC